MQLITSDILVNYCIIKSLFGGGKMDHRGFECFRNTKVLVTGANGFIGSHLVKRLLESEAKVLAIVKNRYNLWRLEEYIPWISIEEININDGNKLESKIRLYKPDYVFHLAAYGVDFNKQDYLEAIKSNILGTFNVVNSLKNVSFKKLINLGSSAEYGDKKNKMKEDMLPEPLNSYGSTKACATILAHQIARENNINIITLRPFGVFGEGEERHKLFCDIIMSVLENKEIELTKGEQLRDYCYVENIIDGMMLAAQSDDIKNEIFNIASGEIHPLNYFVDLIMKHMSYEKKPVYGAIPYRKNGLWSPVANIDKIKTMLNWSPRISLEEGIECTVNWFKENSGHYRE